METSYKEKYEQALERLKQWDREHPCAGYVLSDRDKFIFPELAESEDEKVIKEIIELVMQPTWKTEEEFHRRNVLCAWLENVPVTIDHEKREGFHLGYKACLEKQGEQKPEENKGNIGGISANWSEEDEDYFLLLNSICKDAEEKYRNSPDVLVRKEIANARNWLKSLRPQNTWKPSDEQIKVCKEVYADILSAKGFDIGTVVSELNRMEEQLKKLKEK